MGGYSIGYWGILDETTWGTSLISGAGVTAYWLGVIPAGAGAHPWVTRSIHRKVAIPGAEYSATMYQGPMVPKGTVNIALLDAVPLWYAFGESANGGAAPFTHALTLRDGSPMPDPPSFTWHRELVDPAGVLTDDRLQVNGLRVESCRISAYTDKNNGMVTAQLGLVGKTQDDTIAFSLTTKPAARIASKEPFNFKDLSTKTLGGDDIAGLRGFDLWWTRPITPEFQFRTTGGTNTSNQVYAHHFDDLIGPFLRLEVEPEDFTKIGFKDLDAATPAKDLSLVLTRATSDTITFTGTNWHPSVARDPIHKPGDSYRVILEGPLEALTCAVQDSLDGAVHYA